MAPLLSPKKFIANVRRCTLAWLGLATALFILIGTASTASAKTGYATIVNLTGNKIYVAAAQFKPGVNNSGLAFVPNNYMQFNGWYPVEAGQAIDLPSGGFYVEQNGNQIKWSNQNEYSGLVYPGYRFDNVLIRSGTYSSLNSIVYYDELTRFLNANPGYKRVTYQSLGEGRWSVTSSTGSPQRYQVVSQTFNYDYKTRDPHIYNDCYYVSGSVISYGYSAQTLNTSGASWTQNTSSVCLSVRVEGYQQYPGAARTQGYYVGWVTVYYTVPY